MELKVYTRALMVMIIMLISSLGFAAGPWFVGPGGIDGAGHGLSAGDPFATIQYAIGAATEGDVINLAAGTYVEVGQIVIDKSLSFIGADKTTTIIKPAGNTGSSVDTRGWFLVNAGKEFNLSNVTLDGDGKLIFMAVLSHVTGTIDNNIVKNMNFSSYLGMGLMMYG